MRKRFLFTTTVILLSLLGISACSGVLIPSTGEQNQPDLQATQNWLIVQAAQATATQLAAATQVAQVLTQSAQVPPTSEPVIITATSSPEQPTNTPTQEPTATEPPAPTATQQPPTATVILPTQTPVVVLVTPLPSPTPQPCNAAGFVADVTVPDGTVFSPGANFTKTWRLRNTGTCTWNTSYDLVFYDGNSMNGPVSVDLPGSVAPDQVIDVSVNLSAPTTSGTYRGNWKLRTDGGLLFGLKNNRPFYVEIKVENPTSQYPYDFAAGFCSAAWSSGAGDLPCPSQDNDSRGFVLRFDKPQLENGQIDDEPALLTNPQIVTDGVIRGKYPAFRVESGYHFQSLIGCARDAKNCDVRFQLDYQIGDGSIQTLASWAENYNEALTSVDVDLSSLAGKDVKFILTVFANGASNGDRAQWLAPRITKK
jgi:hypothetical protein